MSEERLDFDEAERKLIAFVREHRTGGMRAEAAAAVLGCSVKTVMRDLPTKPLGKRTALVLPYAMRRDRQDAEEMAALPTVVDAMASALGVHPATLVGVGLDRQATSAEIIEAIRRGLQKQRRTNLLAADRREVERRDGDRCRYCSRRLNRHTRRLDHVIPVARGGSSNALNLVASCTDCNYKKGARTVAEAGMVLLPQPGSDELTELEQTLVRGEAHLLLRALQ